MKQMKWNKTNEHTKPHVGAAPHHKNVKKVHISFWRNQVDLFSVKIEDLVGSTYTFPKSYPTNSYIVDKWGTPCST